MAEGMLSHNSHSGHGRHVCLVAAARDRRQRSLIVDRLCYFVPSRTARTVTNCQDDRGRPRASTALSTLPQTPLVVGDVRAKGVRTRGWLRCEGAATHCEHRTLATCTRCTKRAPRRRCQTAWGPRTSCPDCGHQRLGLHPSQQAQHSGG